MYLDIAQKVGTNFSREYSIEELSCRIWHMDTAGWQWQWHYCEDIQEKKIIKKIVLELCRKEDSVI